MNSQGHRQSHRDIVTKIKILHLLHQLLRYCCVKEIDYVVVVT